jgi:hypothetical protein
MQCLIQHTHVFLIASISIVACEKRSLVEPSLANAGDASRLTAAVVFKLAQSPHHESGHVVSLIDVATSIRTATSALKGPRQAARYRPLWTYTQDANVPSQKLCDSERGTAVGSAFTTSS